MSDTGKGTEAQNQKKEIICTGCNAHFPSKNVLFKHLRASEGKCFSPSDYKDFLKHVVNSERNCEKIIILYGYIPSDHYLNLGLRKYDEEIATLDPENTKIGVCGGVHAAQLVLDAIENVSYGGEVDDDVKSKKDNTRPNRSYGHFSRSSEICAQDEYTGAITEVMTLRAPPLLVEDCPDADTQQKEEQALQKWINSVNDALAMEISELASLSSLKHPGKVKVFGRLTAPKKFNAEMDVFHRRIDYLVPADLIFGEDVRACGLSRTEFLESLNAFHSGKIPEKVGGHNEKKDNPYGSVYVSKLKKLMQRFSTKVVELDAEDKSAVLAKEFHRQKRAKYGKGSKNMKGKCDKDTANDNESKVNTGSTVKKKNSKSKKSETERVLKRKRFHNFTRSVMAHEFLSYRRLDRFYHRATVRFDESHGKRPYIVLSVKGDLFLQGQARGIVGLFIAIVRGYIDEEILDCVFDEAYTNLVPCPFVPATGLFASEVNYASWEGKMNAILMPRQSNRYEKGWNSKEIISEINEFQDEMHKSVARAWNEGEQHALEHDLPAVSKWFSDCLKPWAERANGQLDDYRTWKAIKDQVSNSDDPESSLIEKLVPPVSSVSPDIPALYRKVLELLRQAEKSGDWPTTSPKRQLVMVSTSENSDPKKKSESLYIAHLKAKSNNFESASAYSFKEGQGGASGSFSVGGMPGLGCEPPKGNGLFPELMKAAFELEIALCPEREPSSTIAINRNAQFRPHTDNGAGAGQSRSLIVGLGTYSGGELMVEGVKHDIRYRTLQFNGWTERHWTKPFLGERYSLVWFTPKGCEGVHGIDLCK